jgi:hypothetical protein
MTQDFKLNTATVVTAYYEFKKKKHPSDNYYKWMKNFLCIPCYMVIYTGDEESAAKIKALRPNLEDKTKVIILPFEDLHCSQYMDYWNKDYARDHERYHDPALYIIWNEKTAFIKRARDLNPFNTEFYCWADIGMVREEYYLQFIDTFPSSKMLSIYDKNKVYLLNLYPYSDDEKLSIKDACENFRYRNNTGAGVIMCHKDMVDTWYNTYYKMLDRFMELNLFAGKDQSLINCICLINPDLVKLIRPLNSPIDVWFYMLFYFSDFYYETLRYIQ